MAEPARLDYEFPEIDISHLVTEDDEPVDNVYSERQQALLADVLETSWRPGRSFVTMVNVGLFYSLTEPAYVPDFLLSMDVETPPNLREKKHRSYFLWEFGKKPDLVVEVVSNIDRHEERKLEGYARIGIPYYVIYDPDKRLSERSVRAYELHGSRYVELVKPWFEDLGLGMTLWDGEYRSFSETWLRFVDADNLMLPTGVESVNAERGRAELALQQAEQAQQQAEKAQQQALSEKRRADRMEARLRELGYEP